MNDDINKPLIPILPKKAMRITLEPQEAAILYGMMTRFLDHAPDMETATDAQKALIRSCGNIEAKLFDRLEFA